jgi:PIN domain nuclease of toxin-antitoxin system
MGMRLLLDTHTFLWAVLEPQKLSKQAKTLLEDSNNALFVSSASAWEIATKYRLGKLDHASSVVKIMVTLCLAWLRSSCPSSAVKR